jgi:hypothetical protein
MKTLFLAILALAVLTFIIFAVMKKAGPVAALGDRAKQLLVLATSFALVMANHFMNWVPVGEGWITTAIQAVVGALSAMGIHRVAKPPSPPSPPAGK